MQFVCCLHVRLANVFLIVLLSNITYVASQGIFTYSGISVAVIGDKVEMNCIEIGNFWTWRYTSWTYTSWNTSTERGIYLGGDILDSMGSRYTFERRFSGQHNLIINSVDLAHAGRYRCTSVIRETLRTDIQLIVLASHPVCAANISAARDEGNEKRHPDLFMWCSVTYTGNGLPVFNWTKGNVDKNIVAKTTTPGSNGGPLIKTSSFTEQLHYNDSGVAIQCQITFQMRNNYTYMYEGVHVYTWNYTLPYGPLNLRIVQYEDRLECSADGNPTPAYRWTGVDSKRSIEGPVFILDDKDQTVQCTTTNMYANERKNYTIKNGFHGPRNLRIVEYEDHLECSADGNPTPTYRWTRVDIRNSIEGHVIMLADKGQILQCTATNAFATEKKNFTVTNDFTDRRSVCGLHAVELVVIASIAIVFGIVLLIIGLKLRKLSIAFDKVVASNIGSVKSSATVQSSVVTIGERVELKCSVTEYDSTSWKYTSWNSSTESYIYLGIVILSSMRSKYKIDKNISGQHNLIIDPVDLAHAGRYQCFGVQKQSLVNDVQLIVSGSHPVCVASISVAQNTVTEYPHLSIWCSISYTGNGIPVFSWTKSNTDKNIAVYTTTSGTGQVPLTSTSLITQQLQANDSGITFYCRITFQTSNTSQENSVDAYEYMWHFTLPSGPRNLSIVEYEDRLECSADGNPTPTYRWTGLDTNSSIEGPVFILGVKYQTVQCTATNVFGSERKNYTTIKVLTDKKSCWDMHTIGLIITVATLFVFGVVLVIVGLNLRKLIITIDIDKASAKKSSFQHNQLLKKPNSPTPTDEYAEIERTDASDNYCALKDQPKAALKTQVYCELRPIDQRNIKQATKQRVENKDR